MRVFIRKSELGLPRAKRRACMGVRVSLAAFPDKRFYAIYPSKPLLAPNAGRGFVRTRMIGLGGEAVILGVGGAPLLTCTLGQLQP
jgi:hypothetical protein